MAIHQDLAKHELERAWSDLQEAIRYAAHPFQYHPPEDRVFKPLTVDAVAGIRAKLEEHHPDRRFENEAELTAAVYGMARAVLARGQRIAYEAFQTIERAAAKIKP